MTDKPWYAKGLRFRCTSCGQCCTGSPGYVWLEDTDIQKLSEYFSLTSEEFLRRYCRFVRGKYSLVEKRPHYDCIFLRDRKCSVYAARPRQCRQFPWWQQNLASPEAWEEVAKTCEGINAPEAPIVDAHTIDKELLH